MKSLIYNFIKLLYWYIMNFFIVRFLVSLSFILFTLYRKFIFFYQGGRRLDPAIKQTFFGDYKFWNVSRTLQFFPTKEAFLPQRYLEKIKLWWSVRKRQQVFKKLLESNQRLRSFVFFRYIKDYNKTQIMNRAEVLKLLNNYENHPEILSEFYKGCKKIFIIRTFRKFSVFFKSIIDLRRELLLNKKPLTFFNLLLIQYLTLVLKFGKNFHQKNIYFSKIRQTNTNLLFKIYFFCFLFFLNLFFSFLNFLKFFKINVFFWTITSIIKKFSDKLYSKTYLIFLNFKVTKFTFNKQFIKHKNLFKSEIRIFFRKNKKLVPYLYKILLQLRKYNIKKILIKNVFFFYIKKIAKLIFLLILYFLNLIKSVVFIILYNIRNIILYFYTKYSLKIKFNKIFNKLNFVFFILYKFGFKSLIFVFLNSNFVFISYLIKVKFYIRLYLKFFIDRLVMIKYLQKRNDSFSEILAIIFSIRRKAKHYIIANSLFKNVSKHKKQLKSRENLWKKKIYKKIERMYDKKLYCLLKNTTIIKKTKFNFNNIFSKNNNIRDDVLLLKIPSKFSHIFQKPITNSVEVLGWKNANSLFEESFKKLGIEKKLPKKPDEYLMRQQLNDISVKYKYKRYNFRSIHDVDPFERVEELRERQEVLKKFQNVNVNDNSNQLEKFKNYLIMSEELWFFKPLKETGFLLNNNFKISKNLQALKSNLLDQEKEKLLKLIDSKNFPEEMFKNNIFFSNKQFFKHFLINNKLKQQIKTSNIQKKNNDFSYFFQIQKNLNKEKKRRKLMTNFIKQNFKIVKKDFINIEARDKSIDFINSNFHFKMKYRQKLLKLLNKYKNSDKYSSYERLKFIYENFYSEPFYNSYLKKRYFNSHKVSYTESGYDEQDVIDLLNQTIDFHFMSQESWRRGDDEKNFEKLEQRLFFNNENFNIKIFPKSIKKKKTIKYKNFVVKPQTANILDVFYKNESEFAAETFNYRFNLRENNFLKNNDNFINENLKNKYYKIFNIESEKNVINKGTETNLNEKLNNNNSNITNDTTKTQDKNGNFLNEEFVASINQNTSNLFSSFLFKNFFFKRFRIAQVFGQGSSVSFKSNIKFNLWLNNFRINRNVTERQKSKDYSYLFDLSSRGNMPRLETCKIEYFLRLKVIKQKVFFSWFVSVIIWSLFFFLNLIFVLFYFCFIERDFFNFFVTSCYICLIFLILFIFIFFYYDKKWKKLKLGILFSIFKPYRINFFSNFSFKPFLFCKGIEKYVRCSYISEIYFKKINSRKSNMKDIFLQFVLFICILFIANNFLNFPLLLNIFISGYLFCLIKKCFILLPMENSFFLKSYSKIIFFDFENFQFIFCGITIKCFNRKNWLGRLFNYLYDLFTNFFWKDYYSPKISSDQILNQLKLIVLLKKKENIYLKQDLDFWLKKTKQENEIIQKLKDIKIKIFK